MLQERQSQSPSWTRYWLNSYNPVDGEAGLEELGSLAKALLSSMGEGEQQLLAIHTLWQAGEYWGEILQIRGPGNLHRRQ